MLMGGHGVISVTANVAPKLVAEMCAGGAEGRPRDGARAQRPAARRCTAGLFVEANPIPVKWALAQMGLIENELRLPLVPLSRTVPRDGPRRAARGGLSRDEQKAPCMVDMKFRSVATQSARRRIASLLAVAGCETRRRIAHEEDRLQVGAERAVARVAARPHDAAATTTATRSTTASGLAAQQARAPQRSETIAADANADAQHRRAPARSAGCVVKTTPEQRVEHDRAQFWQEHRLRARRRAAARSASWKPIGRRTAPTCRTTSCSARSASTSTSSATRTSATSSARASSAATSRAPSTSTFRTADRSRCRPARSTTSSPAAFAWAVMPPDPGLEAEMLTRLMMRFGTPETAAARVGPGVGAAVAPERARSRRAPNGSYQLIVDDSFDRAWRRVGLALDRVGFTVVDRDRSSGTYFVRYADPETDGRRRTRACSTSCMFWKDRRPRSPSSTGSPSREADPQQPRDRAGSGRRARQERQRREDPRAAQGPAQVAARRGCASRHSAAAARATASSSKPAARAS